MKTPEVLNARASALAAELKNDLQYEPSSGGYGDIWIFKSESLKSTVIAKAAAALEFLHQYAGRESEWFGGAKIAWDSQGGNESVASGAYALAEILELWGADVVRGFTKVPGMDGANARAVASTDLMEQVRVLVQDKSMHPAAPIVLAGAALETALRGAVDELGLLIVGKPGINAYGQALRAADVISKQDVKDIDQMGGLRNSAAHGHFEELSVERSGLMEQQVNMFLARLAEMMGGE